MSPSFATTQADSIKAVSLKFVTDAGIRRLSRGEVKTTRLLDLDGGWFHPEGLHSEVIFGCRRDFTCACRRYSQVPAGFTEFTCPRCKTPLTNSRGRRNNFGHIELPQPVAHPWHLYLQPALLADLLGLNPKTVIGIAEGEVFLNLEGIPGLPKGGLLDKAAASHVSAASIRDYDFEKETGRPFSMVTGGNALEQLLARIDMLRLLALLEQGLEDPHAVEALKKAEWVGLADPEGANMKNRIKALLQEKNTVEALHLANLPPIRGQKTTPENLKRRLRTVRQFSQLRIAPQDLLLHCVPVIPPDLRPIIEQTDGTVIASDLNELYCSVLDAATAVLAGDRLFEGTSEAISSRAAWRLQHSVNCLFDNGIDGKPSLGNKDRVLSGLTNRLQGKMGRMRRNLTGKRVNFSGRSVITPGPSLGLDECALPLKIARELFSPFTIRELVEQSSKPYDSGEALREADSQSPAARQIIVKSLHTAFGREILGKATQPPAFSRALAGALASAPDARVVRATAAIWRASRNPGAGDDVKKGSFYWLLAERGLKRRMAKALDYLATALRDGNLEDFLDIKNAVARKKREDAVSRILLSTLPEHSARMVDRHLKAVRQPIGTRAAGALVARNDPRALEALEKVMATRFVMLNRAPSLHRHSIQAFRPRLVTTTKSIQINPLVCAGFNADFDGDTMSCHLALGEMPQKELASLMLPSQNLLAPATGKPQHNVSQEAVLGLYYLTLQGPAPLIRKAFTSLEEVEMALETGQLQVQEPILARFNGKRIETTAGRLIVAANLPAGVQMPEKPLSKRLVTSILAQTYRTAGPEAHAKLLLALRDLGFEWATRAGLSIAASDIQVPPEKDAMVMQAQEEVENLAGKLKEGSIGQKEFETARLKVYFKLSDDVADKLTETLRSSANGLNPLWLMMASEARGSKAQIRQLGAMRGVMARVGGSSSAKGEFIERPILRNFREGMDVYDFFNSCHGTRKSFGDIALMTQKSGYLTRRLVDCAHNLRIVPGDCGDTEGLLVHPLLGADGTVLVGLEEWCEGRRLAASLNTPNLKLPAGTLIGMGEGKRIAAWATSARVRSPLTCKSPAGICEACYGLDLSTQRPPKPGMMAGIVAAQSIGEPGTQLTLRSKHTGGVAALAGEAQAVKAPWDGNCQAEGTFSPDGVAVAWDGAALLTSAAGDIRFPVPMGARVLAGQVKAGAPIAILPLGEVLVSPANGVIETLDLKGNPVANAPYEIRPASFCRMFLATPSGYRAELPLWGGLKLMKVAGAVCCGEALGIQPLGALTGRDIVGGLPRVEAILEGIPPKHGAILAGISGTVRYGGFRRKKRELFIESGTNRASHLVPINRRILVADGEEISAGQMLAAGDFNLPTLQKARGGLAAAIEASREILAVYREQGVFVNPKHFEVLLRALSSYVQLEVATANHQAGEVLTLRENGAEQGNGGRVLLKMTQACLRQDSFLAEASYGSTRKVFFNAALGGKVDPCRHPKARLMLGTRQL